MKIEHAIAVGRERELDRAARAGLLVQIERAYLGNEVCEYRLPAVSEACRVLDRGMALTLVTPFVGDEGLAGIEHLVSALVTRGATFEVVVNDFGALAALHGANRVGFVIGHLLGHDLVSCDAVGALYATPACLNWLRDHYAVERVELSTGLREVQAGSARPPVSLSLHYPWTPLAVTRECPFRFHGVPANTPPEQVDCKIRCGEQAFALEYAELMAPELVWRGNALFGRYERPRCSAEILLQLGINRLVFAPRVPL